MLVLVTSIDLDKRRISLALAPEGATPGSQIESTIAVGGVVTGTVERVEAFGVFLRVGPGQVGLIPNVEMGGAKNTDYRKEFPPGTEIKVAVLSIEDNGPGLKEPDKLFEPFYTTKKPGEGLGLGLAISAGFVAELGGRLVARNAPDGGAVFELVLPRSR